jgi:hypothetical protein
MSKTTSFPWLDAFTQNLRDFTYYPVTNWSRFFNITPSLSLFTYNAGDEEVEQQVIDHVGSYGSQLSTILKMLDVLNRQVTPAGLDKTDQATEQEFNKLFQDSRAAVANYKGELGQGDEQRVVAYLRKAAKGEFGDKILRELKETFRDLNGGDGEKKETPGHVSPVR